MTTEELVEESKEMFPSGNLVPMKHKSVVAATMSSGLLANDEK